MAIQMIFCVETTKKADTDSIYIMEAIKHLYEITNQIKISKVYMGTKTKYKSKEILKEIDAKIKAFTIGETKVIYCIDTDQYEKNMKHENEFNDITQFCKDRGYDLIWFCHDIEEVFLGKKISDSQKVQEAAAFRRKRIIEQIALKKLSCKVKMANSTNLLDVLDQYLSRKEQKPTPKK